MNVKKSVCDCGHNFVLKLKVSTDATRKSKRITIRCKQVLESVSNSKSAKQSKHSKRRALESPSETMTRCEQNRANMAKKRALNVSIDYAIASFNPRQRMGPDYVCTVCHCMMYKQNVVPCDKSKQ